MKQFLILAAGLLLAAVPAAADQTAEAVKEAIDETIAPALKKAGVKTVNITGVTWAKADKPAEDSGLAVEAGAGISCHMNAALTAHNIQVVFGLPPGRQPAEVHGLVCKVTDARSGTPALKLLLKLTLNTKEECVACKTIWGAYWAEGAEISLPPKATPKQVAEVLAAARKDPRPPQPEGTEWYSPDGTVGMALSVADTAALHKAIKEGQPDEAVDKLFTARKHDGRGAVAMKAGESWRLKLINRNGHDVVGDLKICGVDWSAGNKLVVKDKAVGQVLVIVPAKSERVIKGWVTDESHSQSLDAKELPATVTGKLADGVGAVQFTYKACWKKGEKPPAGEEPDPNTLAPVQTTKGVEQPDKFVLVERVVGVAERGTVKVRYGEVSKK